MEDVAELVSYGDICNKVQWRDYGYEVLYDRAREQGTHMYILYLSFTVCIEYTYRTAYGLRKKNCRCPSKWL